MPLGKASHQLLYWNVAGLKNKDRDFYQQISSFDLLCFAETWADKSYVLPVYISQAYDCIWQDAVKHHNFGRLSGGLLLAFSKRLNVAAKVIDKCQYWIICRLSFGNQKPFYFNLACVYIAP